VSCVYSGALFSTIGFSQPALEFANSYAISLLPLPAEIENTHLPNLMEKLREFVNPGTNPSGAQGGRIAGCPEICLNSLPFDRDLIQKVLGKAGADILTLTGGEERRVFVYALTGMLSNCPKLEAFNALLSVHRVACIGNMLVLAHVTERDFRLLAQKLSKLFLRRSENGFANLAAMSVPPEGELRTAYVPEVGGELSRPEPAEHAPKGFEWLRVNVLGVNLDVLALKGTQKAIAKANSPSYFTLMLDFGLTLNAKIG
jgi:hypothetical protein